MLSRLLLASLFGPLTGVAAAQNVVYVDASAMGAGDGRSWQDAFPDLQAALLAKTGNGVIEEIWVAAGTYRPDGGLDRSASFVLREDLLYGGFDGTEATLDERAGLFLDTVLTGDLAGDDGPGFTRRSDNSYHVVVCGTGWWGTIDGFCIRGGQADGPDYYDRYGGGVASGDIFLWGTISHCRVEDNFALTFGGGVGFDTEACARLVDCDFVGNRTEGWGGGAFLSCIDDALRCRFVGNRARADGGGLHGGKLAIDCLFVGNQAGGGGGASFFARGVNSTYVRNRAGSVGGAWVWHLSDPLDNCIAVGNVADSGTLLEAQTNAPSARRSCIQGCAGATGFESSWDEDPLFVDPLGPDGVPSTEDDDYRLRASSPCVDAGHGALYTGAGVDLDGQPRFVDSLDCGFSALDLGALERQSQDGRRTICAAAASSLGVPAELHAPCSLRLSSIDPVTLSAHPVPQDSVGVFAWGDARARLALGDGVLCIGGPRVALPPLAESQNALAVTFDVGASPLIGVVTAGSDWYVQAIYRDTAAGGTGINLSDAVAVTVLE